MLPLQTMQGGIHSSFRKIEHFVASRPELFDDRIPVQGGLGEHRQQQQVEVAFHHHT
jgi:hypothetical protein